MLEIIDPCDFCGSEQIQVEKAEIGNTQKVVCLGCGAKGPYAGGVDEAEVRKKAIELWNKRVKPASEPKPRSVPFSELPFSLENFRTYADKYRGTNRTEGPYWPLILRYPVLFDEAERLTRQVEELSIRTVLAEAHVDGRAARKLEDYEQLELANPRAFKLMRRPEYFLVIARHEPYFAEVYWLIRAHETAAGTWTAIDENIYQKHINAVNGFELLLAARAMLDAVQKFKTEVGDYGSLAMESGTYRAMEEPPAMLEKAIQSFSSQIKRN